MSLKLKSGSIASVLIILLIFQGVLSSKMHSFFGYLDEIITAIGAVGIVLSFFQKKSKAMSMTIGLFILVLLIGVLSSVFTDIRISTIPKILDAFAFSKFIVLFWFGVLLGGGKYSKSSSWRGITNLIRIFVLFGFVFCIINLFVNINMYTDYRYGLRSFNFIFERVGGLYSACTLFLTIQTIDIYYNGNSQKKKLFIVMTIILMCSTLRARAFAFAAMYVVGYMIFVLNKKYKFKLWHLLIIALVGALIAYPQIRFYLVDNETQARARLIKYGIETANDYFPLGSGFSTYGTFQAKQVKSPLYAKYGFDSFYGLGLVKSSYLTDDYWPAVMAEFGYFGAIVMITILLLMTKYIIKNIGTYRVLLFSVIFLWISVFASSVATASYINCTAEMLVVGVVIGQVIKKENVKDIGENVNGSVECT